MVDSVQTVWPWSPGPPYTGWQILWTPKDPQERDTLKTYCLQHRSSQLPNIQGAGQDLEPSSWQVPISCSQQQRPPRRSEEYKAGEG